MSQPIPSGVKPSKTSINFLESSSLDFFFIFLFLFYPPSGKFFKSKQVINSNAGEIEETIGDGARQAQKINSESPSEVKCCCFRRRRRKRPQQQVK